MSIHSIKIYSCTGGKSVLYVPTIVMIHAVLIAILTCPTYEAAPLGIRIMSSSPSSPLRHKSSTGSYATQDSESETSNFTTDTYTIYEVATATVQTPEKSVDSSTAAPNTKNFSQKHRSDEQNVLRKRNKKGKAANLPVTTASSSNAMKKIPHPPHPHASDRDDTTSASDETFGDGDSADAATEITSGDMAQPPSPSPSLPPRKSDCHDKNANESDENKHGAVAHLFLEKQPTLIVRTIENPDGSRWIIVGLRVGLLILSSAAVVLAIALRTYYIPAPASSPVYTPGDSSVSTGDASFKTTHSVHA